jgi:hypothetical protein
MSNFSKNTCLPNPFLQFLSMLQCGCHDNGNGEAALAPSIDIRLRHWGVKTNCDVFWWQSWAELNQSHHRLIRKRLRQLVIYIFCSPNRLPLRPWRFSLASLGLGVDVKRTGYAVESWTAWTLWSKHSQEIGGCELKQLLVTDMTVAHAQV